MSTRLRVATFNTLHGLALVGAPDSQSHLEPADSHALAAAAATLRADVLAIQEVDRHQERSGNVDQSALIADVMNTDQWRYVPSLYGTPGREGWQAAPVGALIGPDSEHAGAQFGIGLISRHPVQSWHSTQLSGPRISIPLPTPGGTKPRVQWIPDEPRVALAATIDSPLGAMTVATAHLSVVPGVNIRQLRALLRWLEPLPRPLILIGDFNLPTALVRRTTRWASLARGSTFPSWNPRIQLDHALVDGLDPDTMSTSISEIVQLDVSDHCAVVVTLTAGAQPQRDPADPRE